MGFFWPPDLPLEYKIVFVSMDFFYVWFTFASIIRYLQGYVKQCNWLNLCYFLSWSIQFPLLCSFSWKPSAKAQLVSRPLMAVDNLLFNHIFLLYFSSLWANFKHLETNKKINNTTVFLFQFTKTLRYNSKSQVDIPSFPLDINGQSFSFALRISMPGSVAQAIWWLAVWVQNTRISSYMEAELQYSSSISQFLRRYNDISLLNHIPTCISCVNSQSYGACRNYTRELKK